MTRRKLWLLGLGVVLMVAIVSGVEQYKRALNGAREAVLGSNLRRMRDAISQYHRDTGAYPASLVTLVESRYLRKVPEDPFTKSAETWRLILDENTATIVDVKSGADGRAADGTRLSDW
jgi:general secretion pathway protein G